MKKIQETMKRKYTCDRTITVTRLEDLLQDAVVGPVHTLLYTLLYCKLYCTLYCKDSTVH